LPDLCKFVGGIVMANKPNITPEQRELMSGKHIGQSTDFKKMPRIDEWRNLVTTALTGLSCFRESRKKPRLLESDPGFGKSKSSSSSTQGSRSLDDFDLQKFASKSFEISHLESKMIGPHLTDPDLLGAAIERYNTASLTHSSKDKLDNSILGSLLVDIYSLTGTFMRRVLRDEQRSDRDCQFFAIYRGVHFAAADELGRIYEVPGDEIDILLQRQMIGLTPHGKEVDALQKGTKALVYLTDAEALAYRIHIEGGKLYYRDTVTNALTAFDTTKKEWTKAGGNSCHLGCELNYDKSKKEKPKGVSGFCMTLNRSLYAFRHSLKDQPGGAFYHSSYTGGSDVICTGCLTVVNGVLTYLNNFSGHYRPTPTQLQLVVDHLRAFGVPLANVKVQLLDPNDIAHSPVMSATDFLKNQDHREAQFEFDVRGPVTPLLTRKRIEEKHREHLRAEAVRTAVANYIERSGKWYARASEKSKETAQRLSTVVNEEDLLQEVRFCLGLSPFSPFKTPADKRLSDGELKSRLLEALKR